MIKKELYFNENQPDGAEGEEDDKINPGHGPV